VSLLGGLHAASFWVATALTLALAAAALFDLASRRLHRVALDRLVLGLLVALVAADGFGLAMFATGSRPADPLHLVYGIAAPVVLGVARWLGRPVDLRRRAGWLALGALVLGGVLLRLVTTA
jgi:hypothetical protein